jgi:hypothetical protein
MTNNDFKERKTVVSIRSRIKSEASLPEPPTPCNTRKPQRIEKTNAICFCDTVYARVHGHRLVRDFVSGDSIALVALKKRVHQATVELALRD